MRARTVITAALVVAAAVVLAGALVPRGAETAQTPATALQERYVQVVRAVSPSVVQIETDAGLGSGIVYDRKGHVVTNAHVVAGASSVQVTLADGRRTRGEVVGRYTPDDLAVVRISASKLRPARFADSAKLRVGDIVMAIGNPLGLRSSVTQGIVSALGRIVTGDGASLPDTIQTSAAINPGNSGGALVNLSSRVVGIPTAAATDPNFGTAAAGIGFAISSNRVKLIADQLIESGRVTDSDRAYLGVQVSDVDADGVFVAGVEPGGPAAKAGMREGDLIVSVAGRTTTSTVELGEALAKLRPGQRVAVRVTRQDGSERTFQVTLGELP
jgi:S1-C subfamily serine protease